MQRGAKVAVWVLVLAGLGFAQWKYNLAQQGLNYLHPQPQATASADPAAKAQGAGGKRALPPVAVKLTAAAPKDFPLIERSYGTMASPQVVAINARLASQITDIPVKDGQYVKQGDVLLVLDDRTVQATLAKDQATLAKDEATLANANAALDRAQTLFSKGAGTKQDLDTATAAQTSAKQTVDADKAVLDADRLQIDFTRITAPFAGKLGAITAVPGALVAASTNSVASGSLMTITQMQPLKVNFRLPEQVLPALRAKMANGTDVANANITVRVYASDSKQLLDTGKLTFIDSSVDTASGTIGLAADMGNDKLTLWPGERVNVEVEYGVLAGAVTIPAVAVQQGQIGSFVWVVDDQNKVKATPVKVARYEGNDAAIAEGVSLGQQVVTEGQAKLSNGAEIRTGKPGDATGQGKPADAKASDAKAGDAKSGEAKTAGSETPGISSAEAATPDAGAKPKAGSEGTKQ